MATLKSGLKPAKKIIFLNQMAGPLFRELAQDLSEALAPSILFTGHRDSFQSSTSSKLQLLSAPEYDRSSNFRRFLSWVRYFLRALGIVARQPADSVLFIVSNPPFLGAVGLFYRWLRKQQYVILVYDIYPDLLIGIGVLKLGLITKVWRLVNSLVYANSSLIFTIGRDMARRLIEDHRQFEIENKLHHIPCWADVQVISPIQKTQNWFVRKHHLLDKTVVLYSGNMGYAHNIEFIIDAAKLLAFEQGIQFLLIGGGAKRPVVEALIREYRLKNVLLLESQPEEILRYSLSAGDIGIVTYQKGSEGCMIPSKTYFYMAAGLAIIAISNSENDLKDMVRDQSCGMWVSDGDAKDLASAIRLLHNDPDLLGSYKDGARQAAVGGYSRKNSGLFANTMRQSICFD